MDWCVGLAMSVQNVNLLVTIGLLHPLLLFMILIKNLN